MFAGGKSTAANTSMPNSDSGDVEIDCANRKPKDYLVYSIVALVLCLNPLGIVPLIYGILTNKMWKRGDYVGAQRASHKARLWRNITCLAMGVMMNIVQGYIFYVIYIQMTPVWFVLYRTLFNV